MPQQAKNSTSPAIEQQEEGKRITKNGLFFIRNFWQAILVKPVESKWETFSLSAEMQYRQGFEGKKAAPPAQYLKPLSLRTVKKIRQLI